MSMIAVWAPLTKLPRTDEFGAAGASIVVTDLKYRKGATCLPEIPL
jgi:hypothetical protein